MHKIKEFIRMVSILAGAILVGALALIVIYAFPTGRFKDNVAKSSYIFDIEEAYPEAIPGYAFTRLDNFTDSIMLGIAMYNGDEDIGEKAMANYRMVSDELGIVKSTTHYANDVKEEFYRQSYERYWHGYLVILKPLLAFFTYGEIRILNGLFQLTMSILNLKAMRESRVKKYIPAYVAAFLFMNPAAVFLSLQYSTIYNILLIVIFLWLNLLKGNRLSQQNVTILFLISGCITSYLDFLTYPIVVVGVLTILSINTLGGHLENVLLTFKNIIYWGIGYVGMWAGKWLVGSLILKENLFEDAIRQFKLRSSYGIGEKGNRLDAIMENIEVCGDWIFIFVIILFVIYAIFVFYKNRIKVEKKHLGEILMYGIVSLMPFAWMLLASNHSEVHAWFVYRGMSVTVLALICMFLFVRENCSISCEK